MIRRFAILIAVLTAVGAIAIVMGPRVETDTRIRFVESTIGDDVDTWLSQREAAFGVSPDVAKHVVWANPATRARTPTAIVYVHGFSATLQEIRPLPDIVARELGANLHYTRLTGHGLGGDALAAATVNDWVNDIAEALAIGRRIGERVIIVATSTGAGLATWAATRPDLSERIAGMVLVSPNYSVRASGAWLLTMPWGSAIAEMVGGPVRSWEPLNPLHGRYWTTSYPTRAVLPMAALTELARKSPVRHIGVPAMFIYSPRDKVVDHAVTAKIARQWGAPTNTTIVEDSGDPSEHVIAGDALSPGTTARLAADTVRWIRSIDGDAAAHDRSFTTVSGLASRDQR